MILDNMAIFSDAQAITADAASTNVLDLGEMGVAAYNSVQLVRNLGKGSEIPLLIQVVEDFDNLTSLKVSFQESVDSAFTVPVTLLEETVLLADLVAGKIFRMDKFPREIKKRFVRVFYDVTGTAPTSGKMTAAVVTAVDGAYRG